MASMRGKQPKHTLREGEAVLPDLSEMIALPVVDRKVAQTPASGPFYWRSDAELKGDLEFKKIAGGEFFPGADEAPSGTSRRQFIQVMGASMALAGLTGCRRPVEKILPFDRKPEELVPGIPVNYASAMPFRGHLRPVLVESTDGRPTKVEGNPDHPESTGSTSIFEQASLLDLYDPDRSQHVLHSGATSSWNEFVAFAAALPASTRLAVIAAPSSSSVRSTLRTQLEDRFSSLMWADYASTGDDQGIKAARALFGRPLRATHQMERASVIVSLDADFLGSADCDTLLNTSGFSEGRRVEETGEMNRLYAVESRYTLTGAAADNRLRVRSSQIAGIAAALARTFGHSVSGGTAFDGHPFVHAVAQDLRTAGRTGLVVAGEQQPSAVHAMAAWINYQLGAVGTTVSYVETGEEDADTRVEDLSRIVSTVSSGQVDVLVMLGCNPVYDAPADLGLAQAVSTVSTSIHLGTHVDETASASTWHLPQAHYLEAWNDGRSSRGTRSIVQPLIAPLYDDARSDLELLALLASGAETTGYELVRTTWRSYLTDNFGASWKKVLHDGFLPGNAFAAVSVDPNASALPTSVSDPDADSIEVVVHLDATVLDGAFANNAWLQELPDPITKVVWENVAVMNQATADDLGVEMRLVKGRYFTDRVSITVDGRSIDVPIWILPGVADRTICLSLGYGRAIASGRPERHTNLFDTDDYTDIYGAGAVASGAGVNVAPLRSSETFSILSNAQVVKSGSDYLVASTQDHGALPIEGIEVERRGLYRSATLAEFKQDPQFVREMEPKPIREAWEDYPTLWEKNHPRITEEYQDNDYYQHQWAMTIDLNACTGCNACLLACQAENNIQVVGKEEVSLGREMHWIRMDRYFVSGDDGSYDEPRLVMQPVPCMHCENAPCEQVCPVAATVHSPDGTNQMVYNRCIGTRYCANNCPYKVRRFNYYNWTKTLPASVQMAQNPNVTVRSRGVMEKCSFCIQRVRDVNRKMSVEKREMQVDEVQTACQQVCPAHAITFGDVAEPASAVNETRRSRRRYEMLAELNVLPRTSFLARVRNPNPMLENEA